MARLIIVRPYPIASVGGTYENAARILTPDPKEAAITAGGAKTLSVNLGSVRQIDTIFVGFTNDTGGGVLSFDAVAGGATIVIDPVNVASTDLFETRRHFLKKLDTPINAQTINIYSSGNWPAGYSIGVVVVGLSFSPIYGQEWGAGRQVVDTGTAERLFGGGFGIDEGTRASSYSWTFGDLQSAELRQLHAINMDRGTTRSILVVEDPDQTAGLSERIHWGLFQKLEAYERLDPANTKLAMQIGDWA